MSLFEKIGKHRDFIHRKCKAIGYYDGTRDFSDSKANRRSVRLQALENAVIDLEIEWVEQNKKERETVEKEVEALTEKTKELIERREK